MCKGINFTNSLGWVKKVTACSRWLFFGTGELGDCGRLEILIAGCVGLEMGRVVQNKFFWTMWRVVVKIFV